MIDPEMLRKRRRGVGRTDEAPADREVDDEMERLVEGGGKGTVGAGSFRLRLPEDAVREPRDPPLLSPELDPAVEPGAAPRAADAT